ncbi:MAG TPA: DUF5995 family protein [Acidimicrobiales bacterium]|nr:DUF5995 family protein [Acidimicrobiales bacterium]
MRGQFARGVLCGFCLLTASCAADAPSQSVSEVPGLAPSPGEPRTQAWAALVGELDTPIGGTSESSCHRGEPACLEAVIGEMDARLAERPCANTAPFAFMYLEMTRGVLDDIDDFDDPRIVSLMDARFARLYFDAVDNWDAGRVDDVPAAWQIAFATAERGESPAAVDLLLGMNAHISRDLAYVVETAFADLGESPERIDDFERVNQVIGSVKSSMLERSADRFDPLLLLLDLEVGVDEAPQPVELIGQWRTVAFELGRRLTQASSPEERAEVVAEIERQAAAGAGVVVALEAGLNSPALSPTERDRYCEEHLAQPSSS